MSHVNSAPLHTVCSL